MTSREWEAQKYKQDMAQLPEVGSCLPWPVCRLLSGRAVQCGHMQVGSPCQQENQVCSAREPTWWLLGWQEAGLEAYEAMPVELFGEAMLRGMGWQEGRCVGKNAKGVRAGPAMGICSQHVLGQHFAYRKSASASM